MRGVNQKSFEAVNESEARHPRPTHTSAVLDELDHKLGKRTQDFANDLESQQDIKNSISIDYSSQKKIKIDESVPPVVPPVSNLYPEIDKYVTPASNLDPEDDKYVPPYPEIEKYVTPASNLDPEVTKHVSQLSKSAEEPHSYTLADTILDPSDDHDHSKQEETELLTLSAKTQKQRKFPKGRCLPLCCCVSLLLIILLSVLLTRQHAPKPSALTNSPTAANVPLGSSFDPNCIFQLATGSLNRTQIIPDISLTMRIDDLCSNYPSLLGPCLKRAAQPFSGDMYLNRGAWYFSDEIHLTYRSFGEDSVAVRLEIQYAHDLNRANRAKVLNARINTTSGCVDAFSRWEIIAFDSLQSFNGSLLNDTEFFVSVKQSPRFRCTNDAIPISIISEMFLLNPLLAVQSNVTQSWVVSSPGRLGIFTADPFGNQDITNSTFLVAYNATQVSSQPKAMFLVQGPNVTASVSLQRALLLDQVLAATFPNEVFVHNVSTGGDDTFCAQGLSSQASVLLNLVPNLLPRELLGNDSTAFDTEGPSSICIDNCASSLSQIMDGQPATLAHFQDLSKCYEKCLALVRFPPLNITATSRRLLSQVEKRQSRLLDSDQWNVISLSTMQAQANSLLPSDVKNIFTNIETLYEAVKNEPDLPQNQDVVAVTNTLNSISTFAMQIATDLTSFENGLASFYNIFITGAEIEAEVDPISEGLDNAVLILNILANIPFLEFVVGVSVFMASARDLVQTIVSSLDDAIGEVAQSFLDVTLPILQSCQSIRQDIVIVAAITSQVSQLLSSVPNVNALGNVCQASEGTLNDFNSIIQDTLSPFANKIGIVGTSMNQAIGSDSSVQADIDKVQGITAKLVGFWDETLGNFMNTLNNALNQKIDLGSLATKAQQSLISACLDTLTQACDFTCRATAAVVAGVEKVAADAVAAADNAAKAVEDAAAKAAQWVTDEVQQGLQDIDNAAKAVVQDVENGINDVVNKVKSWFRRQRRLSIIPLERELDALSDCEDTCNEAFEHPCEISVDIAFPVFLVMQQSITLLQVLQDINDILSVISPEDLIESILEPIFSAAITNGLFQIGQSTLQIPSQNAGLSDSEGMLTGQLKIPSGLQCLVDIAINALTNQNSLGDTPDALFACPPFQSIVNEFVSLVNISSGGECLAGNAVCSQLLCLDKVCCNALSFDAVTLAECSSCSTPSGACSACKTGFALIDEACLLQVGLGFPCQDSAICLGDGSVCVGASDEVSGVCCSEEASEYCETCVGSSCLVCQVGFSLNGNGLCQSQCDQGFYWSPATNGGSCVPQIDAGNVCTSDNSCLSGKCLPSSTGGDSVCCSTVETYCSECDPTSGVCTSCSSHTVSPFPVNGVCVPLTQPGGVCTLNQETACSSGLCLDGYCCSSLVANTIPQGCTACLENDGLCTSCSSTYYLTTSGYCAARMDAGGSCFGATSNNPECLSTICLGGVCCNSMVVGCIACDSNSGLCLECNSAYQSEPENNICVLLASVGMTCTSGTCQSGLICSSEGTCCPSSVSNCAECSTSGQCISCTNGFGPPPNCPKLTPSPTDHPTMPPSCPSGTRSTACGCLPSTQDCCSNNEICNGVCYGTICCSSGDILCGSICMPSTSVCCPNGDGYCASGQTCCSKSGGGYDCVPDSGVCCPGESWYCAAGQTCTSSACGECLSAGETCCTTYACKAGYQCCSGQPGGCVANNVKCCPSGQKACGNTCIPDSSTCCDSSTSVYCPHSGDTTNCCYSLCKSSSDTCCDSNHYCGSGESCCGSSCMPNGGACCSSSGSYCNPGNSCCGSGCMPNGAQCCSGGRYCSGYADLCCDGVCLHFC